MDSCWQNTPTEIVNYILKLACSKLIYRDGRYIEIGKVKETNCINKYVTDRLSIIQYIDFTLRRDGWYLQIVFNKNIYENENVLRHGIYFDYYFDYDNYKICYWSERATDTDNLCTIMSTIMN